jgi:hypothetical protein
VSLTLYSKLGLPSECSAQTPPQVPRKVSAAEKYSANVLRRNAVCLAELLLSRVARVE